MERKYQPPLFKWQESFPFHDDLNHGINSSIAATWSKCTGQSGALVKFTFMENLQIVASMPGNG